jgi:transcriptional regulator with XRE-family HTH domain
MANVKRLGARLRALREQSGLTQSLLAEQTGVSQNYISTLERGEINSPDMEILCLLGNKLGLTPNDISELAGWWSPKHEPEVPQDLTWTINRLLKLPKPEREPLVVILTRMVNATYREAAGV